MNDLQTIFDPKGAENMKKPVKPLIYLALFALFFLAERFVFPHPVLQMLAMAFGVLTLLFPDMVIEEPEQVSKSFPDFWHQLDLIKKAAEGKTES